MFGDDDEYLLCGSSDGSRCLHRVLKKLCEICAGKGRCEHGKAPSRCMACGGGGICSHGRQRSQCVECGGNGICVHRRIKSRCKECGGSGVCPHGRRRYRCHFCREEKELTAANEAPFKLREHFLGAESDAQHENTNALTRKDFEPSPKEARTESDGDDTSNGDGDDTSNEEIGNGDDDDDAARALDPTARKEDTNTPRRRCSQPQHAARGVPPPRFWNG